MNEFVALRIRARERRDKAVAHAKAEYTNSLKQIAELEQRLVGRTDPRCMKLSAAVEHVIPRDEPFTLSEVMASLEGMDPGRLWNERSVQHHITTLREKGLVRRLKRAKVGEPAHYGRCNGESEQAHKSLRQIVLEVVKQPMRTAEVCVAVVEAGYQTKMHPSHLRTTVIRKLRESGFKEVGGKWRAG